MTDDRDSAQRGKPHSRPKSAETRDRLAAALRANLQRRKAQQRERAAEAGDSALPGHETPPKTP
jgi:hypothetical protein